MRLLKRCIRETAVLLLCLALLPGAGAEELASELSGGLEAVPEEQVELTQQLQEEWSEQTGQLQESYTIAEANLNVGYVAQYGARLSPFDTKESALVSMNRLVFESLIELDDTQKPSPMLADNWEHEGKDWQFTLRSGITFHNGAPLTAYDVEATYRRFVSVGESNPDCNPYSSKITSFISDLMAIDDRTVVVKAKNTGYMTLYAMDFPIVQSATVNDDMPRGTGPYWYVSYTPDRALRVEKNPLWWQKEPTVGTIDFTFYPDTGTALQALQTGKVNMLATSSPKASLSRKLANLASLDYSNFVYELLAPNLSSSSHMSDPNVRRAVMYAIDMASIASDAYVDMATQSEVPVLPGTWLYESRSAVFYYSPERALQYLYDSGWSDLTGDTRLNKLNGVRMEELTIRLITYNEDGNTMRANAAKMIAEYLEAVGMRVQVEVLSLKRFKYRLEERSFEIALMGVKLNEVPLLGPLLSSGGSINYSHAKNDTMDELLSQVRVVETETELKDVFSKIQMLIIERMPFMGLLFRNGVVLADRSLGGLSGLRSMSMFRGLQYLK